MMPDTKMAPSAGQGPDYSFIMSPGKPPRRNPLSAHTSMPVRIVIFGGGLLLLLVLFIIVKGLLAGKPKLDLFISVVQDQQEIIHLCQNAYQQQDLSSNNKTLVATAQLSLSSDQTQLLSYLKANQNKLSPKVLNLKISSSLDQQLTAAEAAGTYNQTFQNIIKQQLSTYANDLRLAYQGTTGPRGRALLKNEFSEAQLLFQQTDVPATDS